MQLGLYHGSTRDLERCPKGKWKGLGSGNSSNLAVSNLFTLTN